MKITFHDGRTIVGPTPADIDRLFAELTEDPGDFIILSNQHRGEVRAAGPKDGPFLLQCDAAKDGSVFRGEREDVAPAEAKDIFKEFLAGRVGWSSQFADVGPASSKVNVAVVIAVVVASALVLWWFNRAA